MISATQSLEQMMRDLSVAHAVREIAHRSGTVADTQDIDAAFEARAREWKQHLSVHRISIRAILEASL